MLTGGSGCSVMGVITSWWQLQCWKGEKRRWYVTSMLTCYDCLSEEMVLVMWTILAGVRSRGTWLNGKTHLSASASSCTQAGGLCTYIPVLRWRQQPRAEGSKYYLTYCFSCECVSMTRETLCLWKIWFPLSFLGALILGYVCSGLTLAGCQHPQKPFCLFSTQLDRGRKM